MEVLGVVKDGRVELPRSVRIAEGTQVRVILDPKQLAPGEPFEREALTEEDVQADITMATGELFRE